MAYLWNQPGVPHKGWHCVDVIDLAGDSFDEGEDYYETCQMCGQEGIRFVHIMAVKMSGDKVGPKRREKELRNRASQRSRWLSRKWRQSRGGNYYLNISGHNIGVAQRRSRRWAYWLDKDSSPRSYNSKEEAQLALFDEFWHRYMRAKT